MIDNREHEEPVKRERRWWEVRGGEGEGKPGKRSKEGGGGG